MTVPHLDHCYEIGDGRGFYKLVGVRGGTILSPKSKPTHFTSEDIGPQSSSCAQQSTFSDYRELANLW